MSGDLLAVGLQLCDLVGCRAHDVGDLADLLDELLDGGVPRPCLGVGFVGDAGGLPVLSATMLIETVSCSTLAAIAEAAELWIEAEVSICATASLRFFEEPRISRALAAVSRIALRRAVCISVMA